jgi:hypothetical protein
MSAGSTTSKEQKQTSSERLSGVGKAVQKAVQERCKARCRQRMAVRVSADRNWPKSWTTGDFRKSCQPWSTAGSVQKCPL